MYNLGKIIFSINIIMPRKIIRRLGKRRPATRRPKRVTKRGVRSAVRKYTDKVFNNRVKNAMAKLMEVKTSGLQEENMLPLVFVPPDNNGAGGNQVNCDTQNLIDLHNFQIAQGTGESNRIGNVINVVKQTFRYCITMAPQVVNGTAIPCYVRLIFFYDRADTNSLPTPYTNANFVDFGNTSTQFKGDVSDLFYRYNTDRYRIMGVRTHKLGWATNGQYTNATTLQNQLYSNNDSKMTVMGTVDLTKMVIKKQKFNDNFVLTYSRGLYCMVHTVTQDGLPLPPNTNRSLIKITYQIEQKYTDA